MNQKEIHFWRENFFINETQPSSVPRCNRLIVIMHANFCLNDKSNPVTRELSKLLEEWRETCKETQLLHNEYFINTYWHTDVSCHICFIMHVASGTTFWRTKINRQHALDYLIFITKIHNQTKACIFTKDPQRAMALMEDCFWPYNQTRFTVSVMMKYILLFSKHTHIF